MQNGFKESGSTSPVAAPIAWYGGKAYYAEWIISHFPAHRVYVEPFAGMANVLFKKTVSNVEILNDLDSRVVNFFRVLRHPEKFELFQRMATLTPYSREEFSHLCCEPPTEDEDVKNAWLFFVICRQARGGLGMSRTTPTAWASSTRCRRGMPEPVSKYLSAVEGLEDAAQRLREVIIEHQPAAEILRKYDSEETLFYCDPPYPPDTRHGGRANVYGFEMTEDEHCELLTLLKTLKGIVVLSSYDSPLYSRLLSSWDRSEVRGRSHVANSGQQRTEVLWSNRRFKPQRTLF